jgi:hypothetical protein
LAGAWNHQVLDAVRDIAPVNVTSTLRPTAQGLGQYFNNASEVAQGSSLVVRNTNFSSYSLIVPAFASTYNTRVGVFTAQATAGSAQDRLRLIWLNNSNGFYIDSNGSFAARHKPTFAAGDVLGVGFTRETTSTSQFYINGVAAATTLVGNGSGGAPSAAVPMWLGDDVEAASGRRFLGSILLTLYFERQLSAPEMASLHANPWQLFAPRSIWVPVSASSTNPTLSLPTYVPGSLTSSGFRPRVTATWA